MTDEPDPELVEKLQEAAARAAEAWLYKETPFGRRTPEEGTDEWDEIIGEFEGGIKAHIMRLVADGVVPEGVEIVVSNARIEYGEDGAAELHCDLNVNTKGTT